jgi:DNA gyrase subunit B
MTTDYDDSQIRVLAGLECVRLRPGMYIGSMGAKGLHTLVYGLVDNSLDEAFSGHCHNIDISLNADGSVTVADDGRGIPAGINPHTGKLTIETILTVLHAGCRGDYKISSGWFSAGLAVVSALSSKLEAKVWRNKKIYTQHIEKGIAVSELEVLPSPDEHTGTTITFLPDTEIFKDSIEFDFDTLAHRLRELAALKAGLRISLSDHRLDSQGINNPKIEHYYYERGLQDYVIYLNRDRQLLHEEVIYIRAEQDRVRVEVALQWCIDDKTQILGFANTVRTLDAGTHLEGLEIAVTRTLNKIARQRNKLQPDDNDLTGEYICNGLTAIVSVIHPNPEWMGPTKTRLANTEVRWIVGSNVSEVLTEYLVSRPNAEIARREEIFSPSRAI